MNTFISPEYANIFRLNQLEGFKQLWHHQVEWFETPNHRRGGWSGVARMQLKEDDKTHSFFIKKQQNHGRWSLVTFPKQEPTFRREYQNLKFLRSKHFAVPEVVFYGEQMIEGNMCAILITKELAKFQPLDQMMQAESFNAIPKRQLLRSVATAIRQLHGFHLVHRALYPKHIFVANVETSPAVALIDLEKMRYSPFVWYNTYFDLAALNRHSIGWSKTNRLYFFKQYCQITRLSWATRWLCKAIIARSIRQKASSKRHINPMY